MYYSRAIHFPQVFVEKFLTFFSTRDEFRDIFYVFFGPSVARVKKYVKNVSKFMECGKKVKNIKTNTRESEWPG